MDWTKSKTLASLCWMFDAGADEVISEFPQNRLSRSDDNISTEIVDVKYDVLAEKNKISAKSKGALTDAPTHIQKIEFAYNLAKSCNTFEEVLESIKNFQYFNKSGETRKVKLYEGQIRSPVVVFREPPTYFSTIDDELHSNDKNHLFAKIFEKLQNIHSKM